MKVKCYLPEVEQIAKTFHAYNYKDLIKGVYRDADNYNELKKDPGIDKFFKIVWDSLLKYGAFDDRGKITDFIFINCN